MNKPLCPCCSQPLLRHISFKRIYWFCSQCHQEMPVLENSIKADSCSQHWISNNLTERQPLASEWDLSEKLYHHLEANEKLQPLAVSDSLNQVANRLRFQVYLDQEWRQMAREQEPLSLILGNLDFFRNYNDTYGHQAGDKCLQQVTQAIMNVLKRPRDLVSCCGGEEFVIILPHTKAAEAVEVAEAIRSGVKALEITQTSSGVREFLTVSLGVASIIPSCEYSPTLLITAADRALYQAKAQGRDRVILHEQLLRQTQILTQEKTPALSVPHGRETNSEITKTQVLMSYVAYYVSRGKTVISPLSGALLFDKSVYQYWSYHREFQEFWQQLLVRRDFRELHIEGDLYGFGQLLAGSCTIGECTCCHLPVPRLIGSLGKISNCKVCNPKSGSINLHLRKQEVDNNR